MVCYAVCGMVVFGLRCAQLSSAQLSSRFLIGGRGSRSRSADASKRAHTLLLRNAHFRATQKNLKRIIIFIILGFRALANYETREENFSLRSKSLPSIHNLCRPLSCSDIMQEINAPLSMWNVSVLPDPLESHRKGHQMSHHTSIVNGCVSVRDLLGGEESTCLAFQEGGRGARVALADLVARRISQQNDKASLEVDGFLIRVEPLSKALTTTRHRKAKANGNTVYPPYVLERTDCWCSETQLHVTLRIVTTQRSPQTENSSMVDVDDENKSGESILELAAKSILAKLLNFKDPGFMQKVLVHVASIALQQRIRCQLSSLKAVAFIADGSILPRKSGTSEAPMASPPAVPFKAPPESSMTQEITIDMGLLAKYLPPGMVSEGKSSVTLRGLVVPTGITLICGGGYHGKSTLLQTIAVGIYDKIPGDGREFCVAVSDAVTVRAEDGRYVNNCNISAFISNLPTPPGVEKALDTRHFSSRDSSGSTSQAANVAEAIEMGATAMLVDEDVSAANVSLLHRSKLHALLSPSNLLFLVYGTRWAYACFSYGRKHHPSIVSCQWSFQHPWSFFGRGGGWSW